ncbi:glycosyltransferase family 8 protein [Asticcacaulis sp. DXS10W]|uniref:Glycosyltransferase family 8 protein n=1 Tax=Asticcacaulis currens TaxID=2984210 RepID=A0ABT5IA79_9CAUL|nr:glycosyltransferase family 8 protein [Asticcacaulis currens]MDC7692785.1 glycosyltransferase family 8 protein [Asticcacaulis currens]
MSIINLAVCTDRNYLPHTLALIKSIKAKTQRALRVFILYDGISKGDIQKFQSGAEGVCIDWVDLSTHRVLDFTALLHISRATYLRLALIEVLPRDIRKILYLDVDMIVDDDIGELWDQSLDGMPCAAVVDPGISGEEFAQRWRLVGIGRYFNAGMLLIDVEQFRQNHIMEQAIELLVNKREKCELADQDALNFGLWRNWKPLNSRWNFQRKFLYDEFRQQYESGSSPAIIHFTEAFKPWRSDEWHPWAFLYLRYALFSPFAGELRRTGKIGLVTLLKSYARWLLKRPQLATTNPAK